MPLGDVTSDARGSGARYNDGKPDFSMIPLDALEDCARVFGYGAQKYSRNNWMKGMQWSAPLACLLRHMAAWQRGEDLDPESGLPHLGHAMCNLVMLSTFARTYPEGDDRAKQWLGAIAAKMPQPAVAMHTDAATDGEVAEYAAPGTPPTVAIGD